LGLWSDGLRSDYGDWRPRTESNRATQSINGMRKSEAILLVEDDENDVVLMKRALESAGVENPLVVAEDGLDALAYLAGEGKYADRKHFPLPAIVFLDLNLPGKGGHEILEWIRARPEFDSLIVIVLTASRLPLDLSRAYRLGANSYVVKPATVAQLTELAKAFRWYWLNFNASPNKEAGGSEE